MGDCCPPGSHGEAPPSNEGTIGIEKQTSNGLNYYQVGQGTSVIIVCTDVFGWKSGRHRLVCDELANEGYHVYMPDYFHGSPAAVLPEGPFKIFTRLPEMARAVLQAPRMIYNIRSKFPESKVVNRDILSDLIPTIKQELGDDIKLACFGFCFGGWVIGKLCASGQFHCGVSCHPSFNVELLFGGSEDGIAKKVVDSCPLLLMPASNDSAKLKPGGSCMKILGQESESIPFDDMVHGWVTRGDRNNPTIKAAQDKAMENVLRFISARFSKL